MTTSKKTFGENHLLLLTLYLVPLLVGMAYIFESRDFPSYRLQLSDSAAYLKWAHDMVSGKGFGPLPYYVNPGYLYFLAVLTKFSLGSVLGIRIVQTLAGSCIYLLVYLTGRTLFGRNAGLLAYLLILGFGPLTAAAAELSGAWGETLLVTLLGLILARGRSPATFAAAGAVAGIAALWRPNIVFFAGLVPLAVLVPHVKDAGTLRKGVFSTTAFLAAFLLPIIPVTLRNWVVGKDLVLVSSHGGINFYLGNNPKATGAFFPPPGFDSGLESINSKDSVRIASARIGRPLSPSEASRFWFGQGTAFLAGDPAAALRLYARKLFLMTGAYEVPLNYDYSVLRESSLVLRLLCFPFPLLLVTGTAGLLFSLRRWRAHLLMYLLLGSLASSILLFFISGRYRLPLAPLLALYGGYALERVRGDVYRRSWRGVRWCLPALAAVALLSYPFPEIRHLRRGNKATYYEILGSSYFQQGDLKGAETAFRTAIRLEEGLSTSHWYLGLIHESRGDYAAAAAELDRAAVLYGPQTPQGEKARVRSMVNKLSIAP